MIDSAVREKEIKSLLIPMQQLPLLLPLACLAEVIEYLRPDNITGNDDWYLGTIDWRGMTVPLVSFERFNRNRFTEFATTAKIAIMNKTSDTSKYGFYGLVIQGVPQSLVLTRGDIHPSSDDLGPGEASRIVVRELSAVIPDLEEMEEHLSAL
ncbi:MAG: chemotaxis protein CheW [Candidatus Endonucleobacter bathymodioli]|uniref:Chemotaxis protein CheW n=1 Tax=Candidatus Endonucleibacter bathymodioli TaxID=539814 RepID=A0AA90SE27_9GAMM|nr:chemotaxis protein CheW [Candidatus Endonucleobacter bathymodioli]